LVVELDLGSNKLVETYKLLFWIVANCRPSGREFEVVGAKTWQEEEVLRRAIVGCCCLLLFVEVSGLNGKKVLYKGVPR